MIYLAISIGMTLRTMKRCSLKKVAPLYSLNTKRCKNRRKKILDKNSAGGKITQKDEGKIMVTIFEDKGYANCVCLPDKHIYDLWGLWKGVFWKSTLWVWSDWNSWGRIKLIRPWDIKILNSVFLNETPCILTLPQGNRPFLVSTFNYFRISTEFPPNYPPPVYPLFL